MYVYQQVFFLHIIKRFHIIYFTCMQDKLNIQYKLFICGIFSPYIIRKFDFREFLAYL